MRAFLLASATAATLVGLSAMMSASHGPVVPRRLAWRMTVMAPADQQPSQVLISLLGDPPHALLATG